MSWQNVSKYLQKIPQNVTEMAAKVKKCDLIPIFCTAIKGIKAHKERMPKIKPL